MRILFTFAGGSGHFEPLVPVARAAQAAGHIVAFAGQHAMVPAVESAGFTVFATGGATVGTTPQRFPLLKLDTEREDRALREGYANRVARERAAQLLALCGEWRPDLLVCDEIDFGCVVAAERLGLPYATMLVIAAGSFVRRGLVAEPLNQLRADLGVAEVLDAVEATPECVRAAEETVLAEPSYRRAAERIRDEIAALPGPAHAVTLLERLAAERRPVLSG